MRDFIVKNKEITISIAIIIVVVIATFIIYWREFNKERTILSKEEITQLDKIAEEGSYILKNGKLYITCNRKEIEVPGNFSNVKSFEDETFQISDFKIVFSNYDYANGNSFVVYSDDNGESWNTTQLNQNENIQYIEFFSNDIGIMYEIQDVAMSVAFGGIKVTNDGGKTWNIVSNGINDTFKRDSKVKFYTKDLGYLTMPYNGGDSIRLYSYTGFGWNNKEIEKQNLEELKTKFNERVTNRSDKIFLKDFENYKPENNDAKISQIEAEKIAEIGFNEADTIGTSGEKDIQVVRIEEKTANNFFTMDYGCKQEIYNNIVRKCYVFVREDSLGNGAMVFVDVTTGLIIGGECFGD